MSSSDIVAGEGFKIAKKFHTDALKFLESVAVKDLMERIGSYEVFNIEYFRNTGLSITLSPGTLDGFNACLAGSPLSLHRLGGLTGYYETFKIIIGGDVEKSIGVVYYYAENSKMGVKP